MNSYAKRGQDGSWEEMSGTVAVAMGGGMFRFPADTVGGLGDAVLVANGFVAIVEADSAPTDVELLGQTLADRSGVPTRVWQTAPVDLPALKARLTMQVNASAGAFRLRFITDIPGQQATYLAKEAEARRWIDDDGAGDFPYLEAEASATGMPIADVTALVMGTAAAWRALDPRIEGLRRGATVAIDAATDEASARAAAAVNWESLLA